MLSKSHSDLRRYFQIQKKGGEVKPNYSCSTCRHNGCCEQSCGGTYWQADTPDEDEEHEECDPYDGPDPYDQWLHDTEVYQEAMDRKY